MSVKTLKEALIERKIISSQEFEILNTQAHAAGIRIEQLLKEQKIVTEQTLAHLYAEMYNMQYISDIEDENVDPELLKRVELKYLRDNVVAPLKYQGTIVLAVADPSHRRPLNDLQVLFGFHTPIVVLPRTILLDAINKYYPIGGTQEVLDELAEEQDIAGVDFDSIGEEDIVGMESDAPVVKLVNHILYQAAKQGASDIHIEPYERDIRVRYRIDGVLHQSFMPPKRVQPALISRIKIMSSLNIAEKRIPQDGRIQIKVADRPIDIRVSVLPTVFGERVVMRLLDKTRTFQELENVGLSERDYEVITDAIAQPNGIVLVTGPTGSGKTSTLYSVLQRLNTDEVNIVTVEDPVEYQMNGIGQVNVREKVGLTFASALRSILRQDPDIVMIGETRDHETAQIATQAALTGHLVLSTLHTNSAAATITRLIDMKIEPFLIASTVSCVLAQRLVRKLCVECKATYKPDADTLKRVKPYMKAENKTSFYKAVGCSRCMNTGYKGRLAIFEVMRMTPSVAQLTMEQADSAQIELKARAEGMSLLIEDGLVKALMGLTTIEEVLSVAATTESELEEDIIQGVRE